MFAVRQAVALDTRIAPKQVYYYYSSELEESQPTSLVSPYQLPSKSGGPLQSVADLESMDREYYHGSW